MANKLFVCNYCGKQFETAQGAYSHNEKHHGGDTFLHFMQEHFGLVSPWNLKDEDLAPLGPKGQKVTIGDLRAAYDAGWSAKE